jgi:hypothetical protein
VTTEEERFYGRANSAVDTIELIVILMGLVAVIWWIIQLFIHIPLRSKIAMVGIVCCIVWYFAEQEVPSYANSYTSHTSGGQNAAVAIGSLLTIGVFIEICVGMIQLQRWKAAQVPPPADDSWYTSPSPAPRPTPPAPPAPTQTRVERSVRVVRATSATTTHHDSQAPVAALESPHKDVAPSTDLVVVRQSHRPTLWTEDHGSYTSKDRRSFDRDIGPV